MYVGVLLKNQEIGSFHDVLVYRTNELRFTFIESMIIIITGNNRRNNGNNYHNNRIIFVGLW